MDNKDFTQIADETIENLATEIEEADSLYQLEIDFIDGVLNIELQDGKEYVINRHDASMQIWVSSPFSGAHHFSLEDDEWISSDEAVLYDMLQEEFKDQLDINL